MQRKSERSGSHSSREQAGLIEPTSNGDGPAAGHAQADKHLEGVVDSPLEAGKGSDLVDGWAHGCSAAAAVTSKEGKVTCGMKKNRRKSVN